MTDIYLVRHSIKMRGPVNGGFSVFDLMQPLSTEGEERAKQLMDMPELRGAGFAAASNMSRSLATLRYILEADNVPYAVDKRLRELDFGIKPKGMPMGEFMQRQWIYPEEAPEGGESIVQCRTRMREAISEYADAHPGEKILIGSHGAAITAFLTGIMPGLGDDFVRDINSPDVFHLTYDKGEFLSCEHIEMPFPLPPREPMPMMPEFE